MQHRFYLKLPAALLPALLLLLLCAGCKQGEGERCQLDSDCADGLICCKPKSPVNNSGVCCSARDDGGVPEPDARVLSDGQPDTFTVDTRPDQQPPDQQLPDTAAPDQQLPDTGPPDQQLPDMAAADQQTPADMSE